MRALVLAVGAALIAACSIGALDGFSGEPLPDGGTPAVPDAGEDRAIAADATPDATGAADVTPATSAYHLAVAADSPLAHFALEEPAGAACASTTVTSAICVYPTDDVTRAQPGIGGTKALRFDATTSTLSIAGLPGDFAAAYSVELWVRLDVASAGTELGYFMNPGSGTPGDGFNLFLWDDARIRTEVWKSGTLIGYGVAPTGLAPAVWHHVVITHASGPHVDLFYVDGQSVEHDTNEASDRPSVTSPLKIVGFVGLVDEIAFYDKTLAPERIAAHYAAQ